MTIGTPILNSVQIISLCSFKYSKAIKDRLDAVREARAKSSKKATRKKALTPHLFTEDRHSNLPSLFIPMCSSENRTYIPIGFVDADVVISNKALYIPFESLSDEAFYIFGVLTSNVHMAWMRLTAGRIKSDYSYGTEVVYNTFPWPTPNAEQKQKIILMAKSILEKRNYYFSNDPDCSYASLYGTIMPADLAALHRNNDIAVMKAYGFDVKTTDEPSCVEHLKKMYKQLISTKK